MSTAHKPTILIGAAGTGTSFGASTSLRRHWSDAVRIVLMDVNPRHLVTASLLGDVFHQVPLYRDPSFLPKLHEIIEEESVDYYLPLFPLEIELACQERDGKSWARPLSLIAPETEVCRIAADKYLTATKLAAAGLPTPPTGLRVPGFRSTGYCLKPRSGTGSIGVKLVDHQALMDLLEALPSSSADKASIDLDEYVIQERCEPPEVTVDAFIDPGGSSRVLCRERIEIKSGVATKVRIFEDSDLTAMAHRLSSSFSLRGVFCFQVMMLRDRWHILDLNTRPGAATATTWATGNDFHAAMFASAFGEPVARFFRPLEEPVFVTRQYADFLMQ